MASREIAPARRHAAIRITEEIAVYQTEIEERFVRASGPGGQHVNKVSTAVELRVDIAGSSLPAHVKQRLATMAGSRMTGDGVLVIQSREHRTQSANRDAARERLRQLLTQASVGIVKTFAVCSDAAMSQAVIRPPLYKGYRFPAEIISRCVWLYYRFDVSLRDISELMLARGLRSLTKPFASGRCGSGWSTPDG